MEGSKPMYYSPAELTENSSWFRNLSQVHSNQLHKHCNRLISAFIVPIKHQAFWCHEAQATVNVEMHVLVCPVVRGRGWNEFFIGDIPHVFLETQFLSNQFQNQLDSCWLYCMFLLWLPVFLLANKKMWGYRKLFLESDCTGFGHKS